MDIKFKVLEKDKEYIIKREGGTYKQHGHFKKDRCGKAERNIKLLIELIHKNRLPKGDYLKGTCRRLLTEEEYDKLREKKQQYYNVNKGVKRK